MKFLRALCLIALLIAITLPVYAETQSVKLSGDIITRGIERKNYDFNKWNANGVTPTTRDFNAADANYFMTTTEVQLDADLTDNVSATVRVVNQRDWNARIWDAAHSDYVYPSDASADSSGNTFGSNDEFKIDVDLAYVTLKEFFFAPLTVKIGRQDLWFGKGFIVGANGWQDPQHQLSGDEWSVLNAFDAVKATWDFAPWTLDAVYAMILENDIGANDDEQMVGLNLGCDLKQYKNAEAEVYYFLKDDRTLRKTGGPALTTGASSAMKEGNVVHTIGARGSFDPHESITIWAEGAVQVGSYYRGTTQQDERPRGAGAVDVGGELRLWENQYAWKPKIGAEYVFYSGDKISENRDNTDHTYNGWDRMYRGKVDSAIHEWYNVLYTNGVNTNDNTYNDRGDTNLHQLIVMGSLQPMDNLSVNARWIDFWLAQNADTTGGVVGEGNRHAGDELDIEMNYDYTEDVSFGLLSAWFWSGDSYIIPETNDEGNLQAGGSNQKSKNVASELVGTCKVSF